MKKILTLLVIGIIVYGVFTYTRDLSANVSIPEKPTVKDSIYSWWNEEYAYRKEISSTSSNENSFELNHSQLIVEGKSNIDGSDLKVIGQTTSDFIETDYKIYKPDSKSTRIEFDTSQSKAEKYFLYYGNKSALLNRGVLGISIPSRSTNSTLSDEQRPDVSVDSLKTWVLKEGDNQPIDLRVSFKRAMSDPVKVYIVANENFKNKIEGSYSNNSVSFNSDKLETGSNKIFLVVDNGGEILRSNTIKLNYSEPLYVAWTMDWEGTIPLQKYLDMMEKISEDFEVPITHYFNPRIYINRRTPESHRDIVSDWITKRIKLGDDIAMHMHMQHDLVEEVGVKAKYNDPSWDGGVSGYDTPSTLYSYDEFLKILNWGKAKIKEQIKKYSNFDIPEIQGYRAGGWFADMDNLRAIQDAGFIYDSSGRVPMPIGKNKVVQPWLLSNTSQPYYPSINNQNSADAPNMKLLEVPNNGADSYWSTSKELISNFYANYNPGEILDNSRIVVYLSHPDWFNIDDPKLRELFTELKKYSYDLDAGPVRYITMRNWLEASKSNL